MHISHKKDIPTRTPAPQFRFRAVSMELVAHLDEHRVDMLIVTDDRTTIAVECENDTIFRIQEHIGQIASDCPEIGMWSARECKMKRRDSSEAAYEAALSEGWPVVVHGSHSAR